MADLGIRLRSSKPGEHRAACPECARTKSRPRDEALAVRIDQEGTATWLCHRCGWKGSTRRHESPARRDRPRAHPSSPPELEPRPGGFPVAAMGLWRSCRPIKSGTVGAARAGVAACSCSPRSRPMAPPREPRSPSACAFSRRSGSTNISVATTPNTPNSPRARPEPRPAGNNRNQPAMRNPVFLRIAVL